MLDIRENVPLAEMTTFKIGGLARYFVDAKNDAAIKEAIQWAKSKGVPFLMHAGGSNVLVPDDGIDALVIKVTCRERTLGGPRLTANAGCTLLEMICMASDAGLGGWEKLAGIPGSIGGAIRGNAGAFGSEIKDVIENVNALNSETYEVRDFKNAECDFSYRQSFFKKHPEWIILRGTVRLTPVNTYESRQLIKETITEREKRHLQNVQAAGSYFMNPVAPDWVQQMFEKEKGMKARNGRVPAGWLIEKAGLKGAREGGAVASEQHPNYIVNENDASSNDVIRLALRIKKAVKDLFEVELEEEAVVIGK